LAGEHRAVNQAKVNCSKYLSHIPGVHQHIIGKPSVSGDEKLWFGGGGIAPDTDSIG